MNATTQKVCMTLLELSENDERFPILDLMRIIIEYVYEPPCECVKTIQLYHEAKTIFELSDGCIASVSKEGFIIMWNGKTGERMQSLPFELAYVDSIIELKNGNIAAGMISGCVEVLERKTGKLLEYFPAENDAVVSIIELSDGNIAGLSNDGVIRIWDRKTRKKIRSLWIEKASSNIIELNDGCIAAGSRRGNLRTYNKTSNIPTTYWAIGDGPIRSLTKMNNENLLIVSGGELFKWCQNTGVRELILDHCEGSPVQLKDECIVCVESGGKAIKFSSGTSINVDFPIKRMIGLSNGGLAVLLSEIDEIRVYE